MMSSVVCDPAWEVLGVFYVHSASDVFGALDAVVCSMFDVVLHQPLNKWMDLMSLLIAGSCLASTLVWAMLELCCNQRNNKC